MEELSPSSTREAPSSIHDDETIESRGQQGQSLKPPPVHQQAGKVRFKIPAFKLGSGFEGALSEAATLSSAF